MQERLVREEFGETDRAGKEKSGVREMMKRIFGRRG
jgi:hypothetical protein